MGRRRFRKAQRSLKAGRLPSPVRAGPAARPSSSVALASSLFPAYRLPPPTAMNLLTTFAGSMMEGFLPRGWDLARIEACCAHPPGAIQDRQPGWHPRFGLVPCHSVADFDVMMGHEIATAIRRTRDQGRPAALILPVGPMGMYRWAVFFLKEWGVPCDHVHGFNMDEWSDRHGVTLPPEHPGAFQNAMQTAFYGPLGERTVPESQRWFA